MQAWDIALTDRGPVLVEVNIGGDLNLPQLALGQRPDGRALRRLPGELHGGGPLSGPGQVLRTRAGWPRRAGLLRQRQAVRLERRGLAPLQRGDVEVLDQLMNSWCQLTSAWRCMNTEPRPIAARSISTNSRGGVTPPISRSRRWTLNATLAAVGAGVGLLDQPRPVLHQAAHRRTRPRG